MSPRLPALDALPLPGPVWLLRLLLVLFLFVHLVFVDLMAGGAFMATVYAFKGKPKHWWVAGKLVRMLPYATPIAVLFGVASYLFTQVLYGPLFYSAAILVGAPFILIVPVLVAAYSLTVLTSWLWEELGKARGYFTLGIFALLSYAGFVYSNLFALVLEPERFYAKYLAHPNGWQLDMADFTVLPRFLHMAFAMVAMAGLWVAWGGMRRLRLEPEEGRWQFRSGATWFAGATLVNAVIGAWWFLAVPSEQRMALAGGSLVGTVALMAGFAAAVAAVILVLNGINSIRPARWVNAAFHSLLLCILAMVIVRDSLRGAYLEGAYSLGKLPVRTQGWALGLFLVVFAAGAGLATWLVRLARRSRKRGPGDEEPIRGPGLTDTGLRRILPSESGFVRPPAETGPQRSQPSQTGPIRLDE